MAAAALDRLRDGHDVSAVLRGPRQRVGRLVVLHARARPEPGVPRVAFVASRRVGDAVTRNRAKRLLREAARQIPWRSDVDLVLVARAAGARSTTPAVREELTALADQLGVLEDET